MKEDIIENENEHPLVSDFRVSPESIEYLKEQGITRLFPIQALTFDHVFDGEDLIGRARTGTGKTLSFALPITEKLKQDGSQSSFGRTPKVLVLAPTRELAKQVADVFSYLKALTVTCIYGGAPLLPQEQALRRGVDVVVGTPGRVIHMLENGFLKLDKIQFAVLDEADEMLNMGFAEDTEKILKAIPSTQPHQTLLFSATIPSWVKQMAEKYMKPEYATVDLVSEETLKTSENIRHYALCCHYSVRAATLADVIKIYGQNGRAIVFANTKTEANEIAISSSISADCQVLHGDIPQKQREITLAGFREKKFHVLVATDVAARGLDIPEVDLIVQCEPPGDVETYIHRSGRTGRAGRQGSCITFYTPSKAYALKFIETKAGLSFVRIGTPQQEDILRIASQNALARLKEIPDEMIPHFHEHAESIIKELGKGKVRKSVGVKVLAKALALITGYTQPLKKRSLLCSLEEFTTILVRAPRPIQSPRYLLSILSDFIEVSQVKMIRLCANGSVVADVPSDLVSKITEGLAPRSGFVVEVPLTLPELAEEPTHRSDNRGGGGKFRSGREGRFGGGDNGRFQRFGNGRD